MSHCRGVLDTFVIITNVQRAIYVKMASHRLNGEEKLRQQRGTINNGEDICFVNNGYHQCTNGKSPCERAAEDICFVNNGYHQCTDGKSPPRKW